jgi:hypothetical protein
MDEFTDVLTHATRDIAPEYFLLPIHGGEARYRERVYCYELYHQMRQRWPRESRYFLNGEADKQAHPYFVARGDAPKPDLIVHIPGTGANYAVIEVKSVMAADAGIRGDLQKLTRFRNEIGYKRALYLIYGAAPAEVLERVRNAGATVEQMTLAGVLRESVVQPELTP